VLSGGKVFGIGLEVFNQYAIRPALRIDISSPVFASVLISYGETVFARESENE
jgi:hypothetical protein